MATPTTLPASFVAGNVLQAAQLNDLRGAFRVLQVVSTTKTDTWSQSALSGTFYDVTGLSVSITPSATSSLVLVVAMVNAPLSSHRLVRGSTAIAVGDAASSRQQATSGDSGGVNTPASRILMTLDSPATTSATTYKVQAVSQSDVTATIYVNRTDADSNFNYVARTASSITVMEISA
jgi:hypothetical protein